MSFGVGVGDIILVSQLSYQLYKSITSGRKDATRDLTELGDVLFGLRCALDHLHRVVRNVSPSASLLWEQPGHETEMYSKLDRMIKNCAATLEDLVSATKMYREGVEQDIEENAGASHSNLTRTARLKRRLIANIMKIRWDMDKGTLKAYRDKLQTHTDAINLVLNTFLWSSNVDLRGDTQAHHQQVAAMYNSVISSNMKLETLVRDIHQAVIQKTTMDMHGPIMLSKQPNHPLRMKLAAKGETETLDVSAYFVNAVEDSTSRPAQRSRETMPQPDLPISILALNAQRQQKKTNPSSYQSERRLPAERPPCFNIADATTDELTQGLFYIFSTSINRRFDLSEDISTWTRLLKSLVQSRIVASTTTPAKPHADLLALLVDLNDKIDGADNVMRRLFYRESAASHVDDTLQSIVASTCSVRIEKEVEEFFDVRREWIDSQ